MTSLLPDDIIAEILMRLPVKSLLRFRCVCKPWCKLLSNPNFVNMHLNNGVEKEKFNVVLIDAKIRCATVDYYDSSLTCYDAVSFDDDNVDVVGASNGLLCLCIRYAWGDDSYCIWNPSTKEYKEIPKPVDEHVDKTKDVYSKTFYHYGFGYDCNIEDYKFVRVTVNRCSGCKVQVYTLGSNSWKSIPFTFPYRLGNEGVFVNGALHWIARSLTQGSEHPSVIVSFDIVDERFAELSPLVVNSKSGLYGLGALGGCLCILCPHLGVGVEVWAMKEYGVRDSWSKLFTIAEHLFLPSPRSYYSINYSIKRMQSFKNGEILVYIRQFNESDNNLIVLYDPKHENIRTLTVHCEEDGFADGFFTDVAVYVESLVSLNTGIYKGQEEYRKRPGERRKTRS